MTCNPQNNKVYMDLMNDRTENDKRMIAQYNCQNFTLSYPPALTSMLSPSARASFVPVKTVNPMSYSLSPNSVGANSTSSSYPPNCGYTPVDKNLLCNGEMPTPYASLGLAYNPTVGSKCIDLNQALNLQYLR